MEPVDCEAASKLDYPALVGISATAMRCVPST